MNDQYLRDVDSCVYVMDAITRIVRNLTSVLERIDAALQVKIA